MKLKDNRWASNYDEMTSSTQKVDSFAIDFHQEAILAFERQHDVDVKNALLFYLPNQADPVIFVGNKSINIGRGDTRGRIQPNFDLSPYAMREHGISRMHARIIWNSQLYMIQDLHSTNHTRMNGHRLQPYEYYPLTDGANLQFGRMPLTVFVINR